MSEEQQESGMSMVKKTVIGIVTTAVTGAGAYVTTHINQLFGVEEESAQTEQVEGTAGPIEQKAEQNVNVEGPTIQINMPAQPAPQPTRVIERVVEKPAPAKKVEESEEDPW